MGWEKEPTPNLSLMIGKTCSIQKRWQGNAKNSYKCDEKSRLGRYKLNSAVVLTIDKKNWSIVEDAKSYLTQQKWEQAISLFRESRSICVAQQWADGVRYADEMIEKASRARQNSQSLEADHDKPIDQKIRIVCPTCKKTGIIQVDRNVIEEMLEEKGDSLIRLHIFPGDICEHTFAVFIDARFKAR